MTEAEKAVYDEEDPEIPADLFSLWAKPEFADDEEIATDEEEPAERTEATEQEQIAEAPTELNELADGDPESMATAENAELAGNASEAETAAEITDDEMSETTAPPLDDDEMAYLTSAEHAAAFAEQETELPADVSSADVVAESAEVAGASSDVTDDDLDDLIDVPILPLPAESTEVTDDDLAFIRAPILSPGDPVSMPSLPVQADPAVPPAELSSPSIVEIVQEQEAIESLGNLTAPKVTDPLALFKKLRDLAEELPHNVYYAFKASRMCATLDEIIADFEA